MIDEAKYKQLKQRADSARQARDKAAGQLEGAMERLKADFDCDTVEEAEKKLAKLTKDATKAENAYNAAMTTFDEVWGEYINEDS